VGEAVAVKQAVTARVASRKIKRRTAGRRACE
jgi:hypothetical protein